MQIRKELIKPETMDLEIRRIYQEAKGTLSVAHEAVIKNDIGFLKSYEGREINSTDINGLTPVHYAAKLNRVQMAQILWEKGASLDLKDKRGYSPANYSALHKDFMVFFIEKSVEVLAVDENSVSLLESIAEHRNFDMIEYIKETFGSVNVKDKNGFSVIDYMFPNYFSDIVATNDEFFRIFLEVCEIFNYVDPMRGSAIIHFVSSGKYETKLRILLEVGADINLLDVDGKSPLHYAALSEFPENIQTLLDKGADANLKEANGKTPLHYAITKKSIKSIEILLDGGANVNLKDNEGRTSIHYAVLENSQDIAEILLDRGANSYLEDDSNMNPVHIAVLYNKLDLLKIFMKKTKILEDKNTKGYSIMHFAALSDSKEMIKFVFDEKNREFFKISTIDERDFEGQTPLHHSSRKNCFKSAEVLLRLGADINAVSHDLMNCIHHSVYAPSTETLKFLIGKGAEVNSKATGNSQTPLHLGVELKNRDYVMVLLSAEDIKLVARNKDKATPLQLAKEKNSVEISYMISRKIKEVRESGNCLESQVTKRKHKDTIAKEKSSAEKTFVTASWPEVQNIKRKYENSKIWFSNNQEYYIRRNYIPLEVEERENKQQKR